MEEFPMAPAKTAVRAAPTTQQKVQRIMQEMGETHLERTEIIGSFWISAVAYQHLIMIGPGGTAKSFMCKDFASRIVGGTYFGTQLYESTSPDQILGPPNIKGMVENGTIRRNTRGMLPGATHALIDEFFNGNDVVLHSIMDILNERVFHDGGEEIPTPLRSAFMGTNKLNADAEMAALWDRLHIRHQVDFVRDRDNIQTVLNAAVLRKVRSYERPTFTTITLDELDQAHDEAMQLPVPDVTMNTYLDLIEELGREGVVVGTRRQVEGLAASLANAWVNGHSETTVGDLAIVRHMFWSRQEDVATVKKIVLSACNPGEKRALDLLVDLDQLKVDYAQAVTLDQTKQNAAAIEVFKRAQKLMDEGVDLRETAIAAQAGTGRIDDLIKSTQALRVKIGTEIFGMSADQVLTMKDGRR
jgi:MoxR-like ATPase